MTALLHDKQAQKHVLVAVTHLKAKAGADNEQTRVHQVGHPTAAAEWRNVCCSTASTAAPCWHPVHVSWES